MRVEDAGDALALLVFRCVHHDDEKARPDIVELLLQMAVLLGRAASADERPLEVRQETVLLAREIEPMRGFLAMEEVDVGLVDAGVDQRVERPARVGRLGNRGDDAVGGIGDEVAWSRRLVHDPLLSVRWRCDHSSRYLARSRSIASFRQSMTDDNEAGGHGDSHQQRRHGVGFAGTAREAATFDESHHGKARRIEATPDGLLEAAGGTPGERGRRSGSLRGNVVPAGRGRAVRDIAR